MVRIFFCFDFSNYFDLGVGKVSKFSLFHGNSKQSKLNVKKVSEHFMKKVTKNYLENMKASDLIEKISNYTSFEFNDDEKEPNEDIEENMNLTKLEFMNKINNSQLSRLEELPLNEKNLEESIMDNVRAYGDTMEFFKNDNDNYTSDTVLEGEDPELKSNGELITMSTYEYDHTNDILDNVLYDTETYDDEDIDDIEYLLITYPPEDTNDEYLDSVLNEDILKSPVDYSDSNVNEDIGNVYSEIEQKELPLEINVIPMDTLEKEIYLKKEAKTGNSLPSKSKNVELRRSDSIFKIPMVTDFDSFESETFSNARLRIPQQFNRIIQRPWRRSFNW